MNTEIVAMNLEMLTSDNNLKPPDPRNENMMIKIDIPQQLITNHFDQIICLECSEIARIDVPRHHKAQRNEDMMSNINIPKKLIINHFDQIICLKCCEIARSNVLNYHSASDIKDYNFHSEMQQSQNITGDHNYHHTSLWTLQMPSDNNQALLSKKSSVISISCTVVSLHNVIMKCLPIIYFTLTALLLTSHPTYSVSCALNYLALSFICLLINRKAFQVIIWFSLLATTFRLFCGPRYFALAVHILIL